MALYIKDADIEALAERLALRMNASKTEAVRQALENELERERAATDLVSTGVAYCRDLIRSSSVVDTGAADKPFIDSLYGEG